MNIARTLAHRVSQNDIGQFDDRSLVHVSRLNGFRLFFIQNMNRVMNVGFNLSEQSLHHLIGRISLFDRIAYRGGRGHFENHNSSGGKRNGLLCFNV